MCDIQAHGEAFFSVQHVGALPKPGYIHPWRMVDLNSKECTCGNWEDEQFTCVHAICAATKHGMRLEELYDAQRLSIGHFKDIYTFKFFPWPTTESLVANPQTKIPQLVPEPERIGKRGKKPGPHPKHARNKAKNAL
ncbi:uncharacterized protein PITG_21572 [Phytophthora infestans T30-4]|uniref:SWIM-type domain-containing protein n=1 Tax=Phytophthora infestans (strain T30-4) TaxID=403677 RepID=D0P4G8_PHYIT|nr:uncharacterized protein PITG_21572 [Phytophthora infestans T30-4]EEY66440.1 hypothetical protein PITG_21572 [Phytophthora infestans T30-4]|eukprot:XP_002894804.1 hypothetical protein PITG_21572 [Phytophthora infestans T30-4]